MDQRNANGGESTGPVPVDKAWDAFADDQLRAGREGTVRVGRQCIGEFMGFSERRSAAE
jgi:hypothetical protein